MRAGVVVLIACGCGRVGFDDLTGATCAPADRPVVMEAGQPLALAPCAGSSYVAIDVAEGSHLAVGLTLAPGSDLRAADLEVLGPDQIGIGRPTWTSTAILSDLTVTTTGRQLVRVETDQAIAATLTATVTPPPGRVVHIAVGGADTNDGSTAAPWQTWPAALSRLIPGDTLIVHDGSWTQRASCAGLPSPCLALGAPPSADCAISERSGTPTAPITIIAHHERAAHLFGTGETHVMEVRNCASWIIDGLHGENADFGTNNYPGVVFQFSDTPALQARHLLATHPNRCGNNHAIALDGAMSSNVVLEDIEVYDFYRSGIQVADPDNATIRRIYVHSRGALAAACSFPEQFVGRGDDGVVCYRYTRSPQCAVDNLLAENVGTGFSDLESDSSRLTASVVRDAYYGAFYAQLQMPPTTNLRAIADYTCLDCDLGLWNRGMVVDVRGATLVGGRGRLSPVYGIGILADAGAGASTTGVTMSRNVLALDNQQKGFEISGQASWLVTYSAVAGSPTPFDPSEPPEDTAGNVQRSSTTVPTKIGDRDGDCLVYVPPASNMAAAGENGAPLGADIVYQTVAGVRTDRKLWNQRTGQFPCGAIVAGVNDVAGASCFDAHERVRVGVAGCPIP